MQALNQPAHQTKHWVAPHVYSLTGVLYKYSLVTAVYRGS